MYKNMSVQSFLTEQRGNIVIEFAFIAALLALFTLYLVSLIYQQTTLGKLDRAAYSVVGIVRERTQLFNEEEKLNNNDIETVYQIAQTSMKNMSITQQLTDLVIYVEELYFNQDNQANYYLHIYPHNKKNQACEHDIHGLTDLQKLSVYSNFNRWLPVYRVTLCIPNLSPFNIQLLVNKTITSQAAALGR